MARSVNKRIGILGGTFNPVHNGHLHIAKAALKKLKLDKVIFIPAYLPPHKTLKGKVKPSYRVKMLKEALRGKKRFELSLYEIKRKGTSYSIRTAKHLRKKYGKYAEIFFIAGTDSAKSLKTWKDIDKLLSFIKFVAFPRPGFKAGLKSKKVLYISAPKKSISSTEIRRLARKEKSLKGLLPKGVENIIKVKKLYI